MATWLLLPPWKGRWGKGLFIEFIESVGFIALMFGRFFKDTDTLSGHGYHLLFKVNSNK